MRSLGAICMLDIFAIACLDPLIPLGKGGSRISSLPLLTGALVRRGLGRGSYGSVATDDKQ
jgi:hypothetical protein